MLALYEGWLVSFEARMLEFVFGGHIALFFDMITIPLQYIYTSSSYVYKSLDVTHRKSLFLDRSERHPLPRMTSVRSWYRKWHVFIFLETVKCLVVRTRHIIQKFNKFQKESTCASSWCTSVLYKVWVSNQPRAFLIRMKYIFFPWNSAWCFCNSPHLSTLRLARTKVCNSDSPSRIDDVLKALSTYHSHILLPSFSL
jgi:hypothetical protein